MSTTDTTYCYHGLGQRHPWEPGFCPLRTEQPAPPDTERDERLRGIQERIDAATAGAWIVDEVGEVVQPAEDDAHRFDIMDLRIAKAHESKADAVFIAAAWTDVPWLLAEVARLDAVVTAVQDMVDSADGEGPVTQADGEHVPAYLIRRALAGGAA